MITISITWSQEVHTSKGDRWDGDVAEEEHGVGDTQGRQQQVEHVVHLSATVAWVENVRQLTLREGDDYNVKM